MTPVSIHEHVVADGASGPYAITIGPDSASGSPWSTAAKSADWPQVRARQPPTRPGEWADDHRHGAGRCALVHRIPVTPHRPDHHRRRSRRVPAAHPRLRTVRHRRRTRPCPVVHRNHRRPHRADHHRRRGHRVPLPTTGAFPYAITVGPDGGMWFTMNQANAIGRIGTDGAFQSTRSRPRPPDRWGSLRARTTRSGS